MESDTSAHKNELGAKDMEEGDEIDNDCLLKEGTITDEDIKCIIREIADNPEDKEELLKILGIDDQQLHENITDATDGALLSRCVDLLAKDVTYFGLAAALDDSSLKRRDLVIKYCLIDKDLIPTSILARGRRALAAYRRALKSGRTYDKRVKVMLIGQDRAGKTSLGRSLRGEELRYDEASTDGVQMSEPLKNASETAWRYSRRKSSAYEYKCAKMMRQDLLASGARPLIAEETRETEEGTEDTMIQDHNDGKHSAPVHVDGNYLTSLVDPGKDEVGAIPEEIASILEESLEHDEVDTPDGIWPVIWELAGQAVDRAMHPIFMSPDAVYLLVFDLSKNLFTKEVECIDSSLDQIMRCMNTVHSLKQTADNESFPAVILVGTHADCVKDGTESRMNCLSDRLCQNPLIAEHVVRHFTVDNTQSGQASGREDPEIVRLRQTILEVAETMPHTKKEIPLHWLKIESTAEDKARKGVKYVTRREFKKDIIEKDCEIEEGDDIEQILNFLHDRGTIVYRHRQGNPDDLVVLDPQWLLDVIRQILNVTPSKDESMKIRKCRRQLKDKGILDTELLEHACKKLGVYEIKQSLLFIMEKFNLLCRCPSQENKPMFLVPCMLAEVPEGNIIPGITDDGSSPVYLTFDTDYVPEGFFSRLVTLFGAWVASKTSCEQQQIHANAACFILDDKNFLGLVCYKSVIKLNVWSQDDSFRDSGCHSQVCSYLERSLEKIREECHWLRSVSWELSIRCTLCTGRPRQSDPKTGLCIWHDTKRCLLDDCAHYIPLKTRQYYCPYAEGPDNFIHEDTFEDWLRTVENNNVQEKAIPSQLAVQSASIPFNQDKSKVQVTLLAGEWGSSKGGLPTVNRVLAIELAKHPRLEVTLYLTKCSEEDKRMANSYGINIVKAKKRPGYDPLDWLGFRPPEGFWMDVVIGHGVKLGKQAQQIQQFYPKCVWIQFEHTAPEELSMFKKYSRNISIGEKKHETEVELSTMADLVVAVGPKLAEVFRTYLRPFPEKRVFEIIPSPTIFQEFSKCKQAKKDGGIFNVLVFGRGDEEDFELKGYDIAPKAIAELKDDRYHLYFVGAAKGELEKVAERLLKYGISESQLTVRGFIESRDKLARQLCEVDLAIMPSRTEGFGLTALEALSAGLPILVGANSGFAEALKKLDTPVASSCVVHSDDGKVWASAIQAIKKKPRTQRLQDAQVLKVCFEKTFSWSKQCKSLSKEVLALVRGRRDVDKGSCESNGQASTDPKDEKNEVRGGEKKKETAIPSTLPPQLGAEIVEELADTRMSPRAPNRAQETFSEGDDGSGEVLKQSQTEDYCNQSTDECGSKDFTDRKLAAEASDFFTKRGRVFECDKGFQQAGKEFPLWNQSETKELEERATLIHKRTKSKGRNHHMETQKRNIMAPRKWNMSLITLIFIPVVLMILIVGNHALVHVYTYSK